MIARALTMVAVIGAGTGCITDPGRPACTPARAIEEVNEASDDAAPWLSLDRLELLFESNRGAGYQLYRSRRRSATVAFDPPLLMEDGVNVGETFHPFATGDGLTLWFTSTRSGVHKIYTATRANRATEFGDAVLVEELGEGIRPSLTEDQRTIYFGRNSGSRLLRATRVAPTGPFSNIVELPPLTETFERNPTISADGRVLMFTSEQSVEGVLVERIVQVEVRGAGFGPPEPVALTAGASAQDFDSDAMQHASGTTLAFASDRSNTGGGRDIYLACE
jgi:hypothetical protein